MPSARPAPAWRPRRWGLGAVPWTVEPPPIAVVFIVPRVLGELETLTAFLALRQWRLGRAPSQPDATSHAGRTWLRADAHTRTDSERCTRDRSTTSRCAVRRSP